MNHCQTVVFKLLLSAALLTGGGAIAQNVSQPRAINIPDQVRASASASALATGAVLRAYQFGGRELATKFSLPGSWFIANNQMTLAGTITRMVPEGQTGVAFSQRINLQELPTWVDPTRLGKEYLNDIVDECASGNMTLLEKGNVSKMPADVLLLECADNTTQTVKLAHAVLVQGQKSNLVFSRLVRAPLNSPRLQEISRAELATFKQLIANLYVCMPNALELCR